MILAATIPCIFGVLAKTDTGFLHEKRMLALVSVLLGEM